MAGGAQERGGESYCVSARNSSWSSPRATVFSAIRFRICIRLGSPFGMALICCCMLEISASMDDMRRLTSRLRLWGGVGIMACLSVVFGGQD